MFGFHWISEFLILKTEKFFLEDKQDIISISGGTLSN